MLIALGVLFILVTLALATESKSGVEATLFALAIATFCFGLWPAGILLLIGAFIYHICEGVNLG